jgi:surfactin synthase thioesterase subunit
MKYLVITTDPHTGAKSAFYTNWYDSEMYNPDYNMIVVDRTQRIITFDGDTWQDIEEDSL